MSLEHLPVALRRAVSEELDEGERVRWAGQPAAGRFVLASVPTAFFGIFFAGFAAFWMAGAFEMRQKHREMDRFHEDFDRRWNEDRGRWGDPLPAAPAPPPKKDSGFSFHDLFPLFGLLFLVVGVGMVLSPVWAVHRARGTVYVVTDRRAIIFDGGWGTHVRSFGPGDLAGVERRQRGDGSGDIILAREQYYVSGYYSGSPGRGGHYVPGGWRTREIGFFGIVQVRHVEQLIRSLQAPRAEPTSPA